MQNYLKKKVISFKYTRSQFEGIWSQSRGKKRTKDVIFKEGGFKWVWLTWKCVFENIQISRQGRTVLIFLWITSHLVLLPWDKTVAGKGTLKIMSIALQSDLRFLFLFLTYHIKKTHTHKSCFFIRGNRAASHYSAVLVQSVPQGGSVKLGVVWWTWLKKKPHSINQLHLSFFEGSPAYLSAKIKNWVPFLQLKHHDLDQLTFKNKEIKSSSEPFYINRYY